MARQPGFRYTTVLLASVGCAAMLSAIGVSSYAGGMSGVQTDSYALPTASGAPLPGLPISYLQHVVIDNRLPVVDSNSGQKVPDGAEGVNIYRPGPPPVFTPAAHIESFDPAIYSVYGILTSDGGAAAIVGLVGGDTQVVHVGDLIGDTAAVVTEITPDCIAVTVGKSKQLERIGFYGGERLAPPVPAGMPSLNAVKPIVVR